MRIDQSSRVKDKAGLGVPVARRIDLDIVTVFVDGYDVRNGLLFGEVAAGGKEKGKRKKKRRDIRVIFSPNLSIFPPVVLHSINLLKKLTHGH